MHNSKNQAYQQQILQLLLREKAVDACNKAITRQNEELKAKMTAVRRDLETKIQQLKQTSENDIARAQMQVRMAKMGRISEQEKKIELEGKVAELNSILNQIQLRKQRLQDDNKQLQRQLKSCNQQLVQKELVFADLQQRYKKQEDANKKIMQKNIINQSQIEELTKENSTLTKNIVKIQAELNQTKQLYQQALLKIDSFKNQVASKTKIKQQKQYQNSQYEAKLLQITKENDLLRDRKRKLQEDVRDLERSKEQLDDNLKRAEKQNKKNKQIIAENEIRIQELEDLNSTATLKCRTLDSSLKAAKREIEELKENIQNLDEAQSLQSNKYKKYEATSKAQKAQLLEKEQRIQQLSQNSIQLKKDMEASQRNVLQLSIQIEKLSKENKYLSQQCQQQQQKRILLEGQKQKAFSTMVRDKDVLSRANFKLLQLLELKDEAIKSILNSIETKTDKIQIVTNLEGEELLKQIRQADRQKLRNGKDRTALLEQWIKNRK